MLLDVLCSDGKLQVDEVAIRVVAPFHRVVWELPRESVRKLVRQDSLTTTVALLTDTGVYGTKSLSKKNAEKLFALFPDVEKLVIQGGEWYKDPRPFNHIETYTNEKAMQREVEAVARYGWQPQNMAGTAGHINVGRTATAAVLTGGVSLLLGASRSKDKLTIAFARESDWLERYKG